jgi:hypothetical protein
MKRVAFTLTVLAVALALPAVALAKGPSGASITGPGLGKTLSFKGSGEASGTALGNLTAYAGFFPAAFGQSPDPMLPARPTGRLGPRFTIHYVVPGPNSTTHRLTQDLYPYAKAGAVTYLKPGQRIFGSRTTGGWFPADHALKSLLVRAGLPRTAPRASSGSSLALFAGVGVPGALLLAGAAAFVARRRWQAARQS